VSYETLSTKIPSELKTRIRKYNINASKVMREALRREVAKAEAEDIDKNLDRISASLNKIDFGKVVAGMRVDRDTR
jgi:post-segregation antitoxin (ccd killing protein)